MQIATYKDAVDYLESFIGEVIFKVDPSSQYDPLERMRVLLSFLGNPQEKFKSILVGGTSGKGSTAYLISHILITAGYKTGFTISPHLQKINERIQVNGKEISDLEFTKMIVSMIRIIETMKKMEIGGPSYFEILIALAFLYFVQQKVDIGIVEVGMGGEFDATNTLNPLVAVLTNVGLDHTNILGKTVEKIAKTKVGIIKFARGPVAPSSHPMSSVASSLRSLDGMSTPVKLASIRRSGQASSTFGLRSSSRATPRLLVIIGVRQPTVIKIVEQRCRKVGAKLFRLGKDFNYKIKKESLGGSIFDLTIARGRGLQLNNLELTLLGDYQVENASLAVEAVLNLKKFGFEVSDKAIRKALSTAFFPGRFEVKELKIENLKLKIVLDGAHNPTKMKEFLKSLKKIFPKQRKVFIIGFKFDKDIPKMLKQITKVADKIIVTEFRSKTDIAVHASAKALNLKTLILNLKSDAKVTVEKDSKKALEIGLKAIQQYDNPAILIVTGSLYLVGEIRNSLALKKNG